MKNKGEILEKEFESDTPIVLALNNLILDEFAEL
jgi:hypothetical protein